MPNIAKLHKITRKLKTFIYTYTYIHTLLINFSSYLASKSPRNSESFLKYQSKMPTISNPVKHLRWIFLLKKSRDKVFKSGPSKSCGRQPLKSLLSPLLNTRR